ncbi:MAG: hypothetical protein Q8Q33_02790 [Chlamydiota bacterium]|nr:hypothetical protein [Chlamydiota bacterium]
MQRNKIILIVMSALLSGILIGYYITFYWLIPKTTSASAHILQSLGAESMEEKDYNKALEYFYQAKLYQEQNTLNPYFADWNIGKIIKAMDSKAIAEAKYKEALELARWLNTDLSNKEALQIERELAEFNK